MASTHLTLAKVIERNVQVAPANRRLMEFVTQRALPNYAYVPANETTVVNATLVSSPNLVIADSTYLSGGKALQGGRTYLVEGSLKVTSDVAGGLKIALDAGTATFGNFNLDADFVTASAIASVNSTAVGTAVGSTALVLHCDFSATVECSGSGSIGLRYAENNAAGAALILLRGSWMRVTEIPLSA